MSTPTVIERPIAELEATSKKEFTKVKAFHIENFKGIENLSAMLDGKSCVFFSRQNGGKTCASQHAIQTLLQNFPGSKLRNGANEGKLVFELEHPNGPALVQIDFDKAGNENVTVWLNGSHKPENKKSGLDFLKSLHSPAHDFDIADIFRTRGQERAKAIIKMLGIDLTEEEKEYAVAFEDRKAVKRDLDSQAARIEVITPTQRELAAKPMVSTAELSKKLKEATDFNNSVDRAKADVISYEKRLAELAEEEADLMRKLQECRNRQEQGRQLLNEKQEWLKGKFKIVTDSIEKDIAGAEEENKKIQQAKTLVDRNDKENRLFAKVQSLYDEADKAVKAARQAMYDKVNTHKHGIDGLSITLEVETNAKGEETNKTAARVRYNGLDFSDTEIAEGAVWATALKIKASMLSDGQLGWFRMQANLLDNDNIIRLAQEAERMGITLAYELNTQTHETVQVTTDISDLISRRI